MMRASSRDKPFASRSGRRLRKPASATLRRDSLISKAKRSRCSVVMARKILRWIAVALESSASMVPSMPEPGFGVTHPLHGRDAGSKVSLPAQLDVLAATLSLRQRVEVFHKRSHRAIKPRDLRVCRVDQVVLIRSVRAGAMAEAEVSSRKIQRSVGEDVSRPRTCRTRPQQGILAELLIGRHLRLDELGVRRGLVGIVAAAHVDFDVAEAFLRQIVFQ